MQVWFAFFGSFYKDFVDRKLSTFWFTKSISMMNKKRFTTHKEHMKDGTKIEGQLTIQVLRKNDKK